MNIVDLKSAFIFLLSEIDKIESNTANVTKTNKLFHEKITVQEQDKVSLHTNLGDLGDEVGEEFKSSCEE